MDGSELKKRILIVGGGFGGVKTALTLARKRLPGVSITLIDHRPRFEYHPSFYKVLSGRRPGAISIPLADIFEGTGVNIIEDPITDIDLKKTTVRGQSGTEYAADYLVLALGSEASFFDIPGLKEHALSFKTVRDAERVREHINAFFFERENNHRANEKPMTIAIVGGGPAGVEIAGEVAGRVRTLCRANKIPQQSVIIMLIEAGDRILQSFPEKFASRVALRLEGLGVKIITNKKVLAGAEEVLEISGLGIPTEKVIWAAGIVPHHLLREVEGLPTSLKGRVSVDEHLAIIGHDHVFVVGDAADTPYSGLAQTALDNGKFVAEIIAQKISNDPLTPYVPHKPSYIIPITHRWAALVMGNIHLYGFPIAILRELIDFRFFLSILPLRKALKYFVGRR